MKLVDNWQAILLRSHSMWAVYLGIALLGVPEGLFWIFERQFMNPYVTGFGGLGLMIYGGLGRIVDQELAAGKHISRIARVVIVAIIFFAAAMLLAGMSSAPVSADGEPPLSGPVSEAEFLRVAEPLVAKWEGKRNEAYPDIVGVWTICYGHTRDVRPGDVMNDAQCNALLRAELLEYREGLHRYFVAQTIASRLTPERDAAYTSTAYNVGIAGMGKSTATRRLNAGDIAGGCDALTWWNKAGGRVVRGLVRRRADEFRLCMVGVA